MSHLTKTTRRIIVTVVLVIIALRPQRQPCGAPGYSCATAPDEKGIYTTFDDIQPSIVSALEYMLDTDIAVYYWREVQERNAN